MKTYCNESKEQDILLFAERVLHFIWHCEKSGEKCEKYSGCKNVVLIFKSSLIDVNVIPRKNQKVTLNMYLEEYKYSKNHIYTVCTVLPSTELQETHSF